MEEINQVAFLFLTIGDSDVQHFTSASGVQYVTCYRRDRAWVFSRRCQGDSERYVLTVNDHYLLAGCSLVSITSELERLALDDKYVILENEAACTLNFLRNEAFTAQRPAA